MKVYIAYTLVVIGIPYLAGFLTGWIVILPVAMIVGLLRYVGLIGGSDEATAAQDFAGGFAWSLHGSIQMSLPDRVVHICGDMFRGFGTVLTAAFIFHLFGLAPSVFILLILAAWEVFFTLSWQASRALLGDLAGIAIGWFLILSLWKVA